MNTVTYEVSFSFEQPNSVLNTLRKLLQQKLSQPSLQRTKTSQEMIVRNALTVLIIDTYQERAQYVAGLLRSTEYQSFVVKDALDAFTFFLQGSFVPFAVVLGQEDSSKHFFLLRLLQQMAQKYGWETPLIRLVSLPSTTLAPPVYQNDQPSKPHPETAPLAPRSVVSPSGPLRGKLPANLAMPDSIAQTNTEALERITTKPLPLLPTIPQLPFPALSPFEPVQEQRKSPAKEKISLVDQSMGRYQVGILLGSSPYSDVYQMYDRLREKECALKAIQIDFVPFDLFEHSHEEISLFQKESDLLNKLQHAHLLPVLNCGKSYVSGSSFIYKTMPYCPGRSLTHWILSHGGAGSFQLRDVIQVILQLADVLQYVHEHNILYQNFKMSNILVLNQSNKMGKIQVALSDFAAQDGSYVARTSDAFLYIAPERWEGTILPASDQYGLAALAYELITGRPPFQGSAERILKQMHMTMQPQAPSVFNSQIPIALNKVLLRALAKKPEERFASVAYFAWAIQQALA